MAIAATGHFGMGGGIGDMFGGGSGGAAQRRGRDLQIELKISLLEAARGARKTIKINKQVACDDCSGSGSAPGSKPQTCTQ